LPTTIFQVFSDMYRIIETTAATLPQRDPSRPHAQVSGSPRQSAILAISTMLLAVLLFNLAAYTVTAIYTSLTSTSTVSSSSKLRASDCECRCPHLEPQQDWLATAPGNTQLCFMANLGLGMASGILLIFAFFWWMTSVSEVSV
jgi:hypothetical protein